MVVFGQKLLYSAKWFHSGKNGYILAKWLYSAEVVVFRQNGCTRVKVVAFGQSGCIRAKVVYSGKVVVLGKMCRNRIKVDVFE